MIDTTFIICIIGGIFLIISGLWLVKDYQSVSSEKRDHLYDDDQIRTMSVDEENKSVCCGKQHNCCKHKGE